MKYIISDGVWYLNLKDVKNNKPQEWNWCFLKKHAYTMSLVSNYMDNSKAHEHSQREETLYDYDI